MAEKPTDIYLFPNKIGTALMLEKHYIAVDELKEDTVHYVLNEKYEAERAARQTAEAEVKRLNQKYDFQYLVTRHDEREKQFNTLIKDLEGLLAPLGTNRS